MEIQILQLIEGAKQARGFTVIIDVFRAFSVEAYLTNNHAQTIIPIGSKEEAYAYKEKNPSILLFGERGGKILPGFDYGNSPSMIQNVDFTGKTIVHTTSAGTQGIANAIFADEIIVGSLVNAKAIAKYIQQQNPEMVSLVCMGLAGKEETDEDTLCALYIKSLLENTSLDVTSRIEDLKKTSGAKFFDPNQKDVFPTEDFYLSTKLDIFNFVLRFDKESNRMIKVEIED